MNNYCVTFKRRTGLENYYSLIKSPNDEEAERCALLHYGERYKEITPEKDFDPSWYTLHQTLVAENRENFNELTGQPHDLPEDC